MTHNNVKVFPVDDDKRMDDVIAEVRALLSSKFGPDTFASYVTIVHSSTFGKVPDEEADVTAYRFTILPEKKEEEELDTMVGLLYQSLSNNF